MTCAPSCWSWATRDPRASDWLAWAIVYAAPQLGVQGADWLATTKPSTVWRAGFTDTFWNW